MIEVDKRWGLRGLLFNILVVSKEEAYLNKPKGFLNEIG
jgi:hypothetical protein